MGIKNIDGDNVKDLEEIGDKYEGKPGDYCDVQQVIDEVYDLYKSSTSKSLPKPTPNDIVLVKLNSSGLEFTVFWTDGNKDLVKNPAITYPRQKKIILTEPLPNSKSSEQVLAHELGHWFFDRYFDDIIPPQVEREGEYYKIYSAASAYYAEEKITRNKRNCNDIDHPKTDYHYEGCKLLRKLEKENENDIPKRLFSDYKEKWDKKEDEFCP